jgi:hypothetical protein
MLASQPAAHYLALSRYAREDLIGLVVIAVVALTLFLLFRGFGSSSRKPPAARPPMRPGGYPPDAVANCVRWPLPPRWVAFIGPRGGNIHGTKYWTCRDDHASGDDALACAQNQLRFGTWDGRTYV